jgi:hypothetical protein
MKQAHTELTGILKEMVRVIARLSQSIEYLVQLQGSAFAAMHERTQALRDLILSMFSGSRAGMPFRSIISPALAKEIDEFRHSTPQTDAPVCFIREGIDGLDRSVKELQRLWELLYADIGKVETETCDRVAGPIVDWMKQSAKHRVALLDTFTRKPLEKAATSDRKPVQVKRQKQPSAVRGNPPSDRDSSPAGSAGSSPTRRKRPLVGEELSESSEEENENVGLIYAAFSTITTLVHSLFASDDITAEMCQDQIVALPSKLGDCFRRSVTVIEQIGLSPGPSFERLSVLTERIQALAHDRIGANSTLRPVVADQDFQGMSIEFMNARNVLWRFHVQLGDLRLAVSRKTEDLQKANNALSESRQEQSRLKTQSDRANAEANRLRKGRFEELALIRRRTEIKFQKQAEIHALEVEAILGSDDSSD